MRGAVRLFALIAIASAVRAQGPSADWRTITTPHFRVHFPVSYQAWASRVASRVESIRTAVVKEVGFDPPDIIDVIVSNPISNPNGLAYPLIGNPRIILFTQPPGPDEQLGAYSAWIDLLAAHEITHIVHLLRPSRNPIERTLERFVIPVAPIPLSAPRWVIEGYATVLEGKITGAGRPPSTMRAVVLREWASTGRLPSYSQLNSDSRFLGATMAYLAGSAYLEWLEKRAGEGSLRKLWARMTARQRRSFASAFAGVFGDTPERLYGQFVAELTSSAMTINRATDLREGQLWQETPRASGDPAISPDGSQMAIVIRSRKRPSRLVLWSTGPAEEEQKKFTERISRIISRDPEDYPPVNTKPLPRKVVHSMVPGDGGDVESPRWTRDGKSLLYSHRQPDLEGFLHRDLFLWTPDADENRKVTHFEDVFDADPMPGGKLAVAVRSQYGLSQLVTVDLGSGQVKPINDASLETVYSHPRVSADGSRLAYVAHRRGMWSLFVRDLATGRDSVVLNDVNVASPEWSGDQIFATLLANGFAEVHRIALTGEHQAVTRSSGGAFEPAPARDGRLFFMGLDPDGFVVRVIDASAVAPAPPAYDAALVPAVPPALPSPAPLKDQPFPPPRPYTIGRQERAWLLGETIAPHQGATELGIRFGDVIGRLDTIILGSLGRQNGQRGLAVASVWRALPVDLSLHVFKANDHLVRRDGVELRAGWTAQTPLTSFSIEGGGLTGSPLDLVFGETSFRVRQNIASWRASEEVQIAAFGGSLREYRGVARASLRAGAFSIMGRYQHDEPRGDARMEIGGVESSILPDSAIPNRVFDPALPVQTMTGRPYDGVRIEATTPLLPATIFYQRHRTNSASLTLAGLQVTLSSEALPILRFPALAVSAGVARVLDEPLRNQTKAWLAMRWRP